jgi:transcriptional regulator with XRE-family HTH domain
MNDRVRKLEASTEYAEEMLVAQIQSVLEELLDEKGFSRADLAKKMGVTKARVSQIFSDTQNFTVRLIARAFHALGERAVIDHEPLYAVETKCKEQAEDDPITEYLIGCPVSPELGQWLSPDWQPYRGAIFVSGWPDSEDMNEALVSFIETQMTDPGRLSRQPISRSESPQAVTEWVRSSNILPFRKERACA